MQRLKLELITVFTRVLTLPISLPWRITFSLSRMIWRLRSRSRTFCLSLAFITASLYLLLLLASHSIYLRPCDTALAPKMHVLRDLARRNFSSVGLNGQTDSTHGDSSDGDANRRVKGHVEAVSDGTMAPAKAPDIAKGAESVKSGLSKLEALFDHPLYNIQQPPVPEEDLLLKVRPKVKASERSSQMWSVLKKHACLSLLTSPQLSVSKATIL